MKIRDIQSRAGTIDSGAVNVTIKDIPIGDICIKENIRKEYSGLEELKASIREYGLLQMITVFPMENGYAVKFGHRRFLVYQNLYKEDPEKYHSIRCIISDADNIAVNQLVENLQREDISQLDLFYALTALKDKGMTMKQIAEVIGKTEGHIKNLFMGVNEVTKDNDLKELISHSRVTIQEIIETKGIPNRQERMALLSQRGNGQVTRKELRKKAKALKGGTTVIEPSVIVQDCPVIPQPVNNSNIAEGQATSLDATNNSSLVLHDRAETLEHRIIEVFIDRDILAVSVFPTTIDKHILKQSLITLEGDLRAYCTAHNDKYRVVHERGESN